MSAPTALAPWYVVFKEGFSELIWFQSDYSEDIDENTGKPYPFSPLKKGALLFQNLGSAKRVAAAEGGLGSAMIRVLVTEDEAKEFSRA